MLEDILREITLKNFVLNGLFTFMIAGLVRLFLKALGLVPKSERLYWFSLFLLVFTLSLLEGFPSVVES